MDLPSTRDETSSLKAYQYAVLPCFVLNIANSQFLLSGVPQNVLCNRPFAIVVSKACFHENNKHEKLAYFHDSCLATYLDNIKHNAV